MRSMIRIRSLQGLWLVLALVTSVPAAADRMGTPGDDYRGHMLEHYGAGGGYGPMGMMGGYGGMGGMMGLAPYEALDLSDDQRSKITAIQRDLRKRQWGLMEQMVEEMEKVDKLLRADQRDPKAIGKAHEPMFKLRREMIEATVEADNKMEALLTQEQKTELRGYRRRGIGHGMGMMWGN